MTFERINKWLSLGANLGVVAGLVLVFIQLNQNERMIRAQTRHELSAGIVDLLLNSANNQQLSDVMRRGGQGEALTPTEQLQFEMRANALLRYWEDVHYQSRVGLYEEEEFAKQRAAWRNSLAGGVGFRAYWCRVRVLYSARFAEDMNRLLPPSACQPGSKVPA